MNTSYLFLATLLVLSLLVASTSAQCTGSIITREPSLCPDIPCKTKGCDFETAGQCRYANKPCNLCNAFAGKKADFIFLIDVSGSMQSEINAVRDGLGKFLDFANSINLDAAFAISVNGGPTTAGKYVPKLLRPLTTDLGAVQSTLDTLLVCGGWEPSLEALYMATNLAPDLEYGNTTAGCGSTGVLEDVAIPWREGSARNFIVLTDEDSDRPYHDDNCWSPEQAALGLGAGPVCTSPPGTPYRTTFSTAAHQDNFNPEITGVAQRLIEFDARVFILANPAQQCSARQYGDVSLQVQWSDFTHFSADLTMQRYEALYPGGVNATTNNGLNSIQYLMLAAGKTARVYNVLDIDNPSFVDNFFLSLLDEYKLCDPCVSQQCVPALGPGLNDTCSSVPLCVDGDDCTTDTCTVTGDLGVCSFVPITCPNKDPCTAQRCNSLTGVCDIEVPVLCDEIALTACEEYRCDINTGVCTIFDRICTGTPANTCEEFICEAERGCILRATGRPECPVAKSPSIINETTIAVGASVAALAIIAAVILAFILWRVKKLHSEVAELDAFAGADSIGANPLYSEAGGWKESAIADAN